MTFEATAGSPPADEPTLTAEAPVAEATDANAAASSPVDEPGAKQPANLLDVVKSAVEPTAELTDSPTVEEEAGPPEATEEAAQATDEATDTDADLPFHNHPRWKAVIAERDSYRDGAERYQNIEGFMQQHGLATDEVVEGFEVMALLKSGKPEDLTAAREYFQARTQQLDQMLGFSLPDDLRERVDYGYIDEEAAQELARSRAADAIRTANSERDQQAAQAATAQANVDAARNVVEGWEQRQRESDPDYSKKAALVETTCQAIVQRTGKLPGTPDEALALVEQALTEVNQHFAAALPKPRQITPSPRGSSTTATAQPTSLREAIRAAASR